MLTPKQKETLQRIIDLEPFHIDMTNFCSEDKVLQEHVCGTTYCIAGRLAHLDEYPEEYRGVWGEEFNYDLYSASLLDSNREIPGLWSYLFDPCWPDDLESAKDRARYVLENERLPHDF